MLVCLLPGNYKLIDIHELSAISVITDYLAVNKVSCPFPKGGTLVDLPGNKNEVLSPAMCEDTGCPDVKFPGKVLPLASTPRVSSENLTRKCFTAGHKKMVFHFLCSPFLVVYPKLPNALVVYLKLPIW